MKRFFELFITLCSFYVLNLINWICLCHVENCFLFCSFLLLHLSHAKWETLYKCTVINKCQGQQCWRCVSFSVGASVSVSNCGLLFIQKRKEECKYMVNLWFGIRDRTNARAKEKKRKEKAWRIFAIELYCVCTYVCVSVCMPNRGL